MVPSDYPAAGSDSEGEEPVTSEDLGMVRLPFLAAVDTVLICFSRF
jgi:hypothetical protein